MNTNRSRPRPSIARRVASAVALSTLPALVLGTGGPAQAQTRAESSSSERPAASASPLRTDPYPGPYADLSSSRAITVEEVVRWSESGGMGGPQQVADPFDPGVDPPYDPSGGLDELMQPWFPPAGPGAIATGGGSRPPAGPQGIAYQPTPFDRVNPVPDGCLGGKLVYQSMDSDDYGLYPGIFRPAFGWSAVVSLSGLVAGDGPFPDYVQVTHRRELDSFGEWVFCPSLQELNQQLDYSVAYESGSSLVEVMDPTTKARHRFPLEGETGELPWFNEPGVVVKSAWVDSNDFGIDPPFGLGDIVTRSMGMLTQLAASGIKADTKWGPHEIFYPNQTYTCGGTQVWSCYQQSEARIHLYLDVDAKWPYYDHVQNPFTLLHELAHSVQAEHWNGYAIGGTDHELVGCTSHETAYTEGFADFLATWAWADRNVEQTANFGMFHIEDPGSGSNPVCTPDAAKSNELWVAAALWDLHDHHADGADSTGAKGFGAVPALYLANPPWTTADHPQGLTPAQQYEATYKKALSKPEWKAWVDGIFEQNHLHG